MTEVFKYKNPHCIEWCINTRSRLSDIKEKFCLRNVQCNLSYQKTDSIYNSTGHVYCESNSTFNPAIDIIVVSTTTSSSYGTSESCFKRIKYEGRRVEIWKHGYQVPYTLTLEIITHEVQISKEIQPQATLESSLCSQNKFSSDLDNNAHFKCLSNDLSKLFNDSSNSDVIITCDSKTFYAHKNILGARSKTFLEMLDSNLPKRLRSGLESKMGHITVNKIKSSIFEIFLRYVYSGMIPALSIETANELYKVGDQYAVGKLKNACSDFLTRNLSENNACDVLVLADFHRDENFRRNVMLYIVERKIPQKGKKWTDFCRSHATLANDVLNLYIKTYCPT